MSSLQSKEQEHQPFLKYTDDIKLDGENKSESRNPFIECRRGPLLTHSIVFLITSALWVAGFFLLTSPSSPLNQSTHLSEAGDDRHNVTSNARLIDCGNSTVEAREKGCKFDILLNAWVPAPCVDDEFVLEYLEDGSWAAFADEALTERLPVEGMEDREEYYTSLRDHINHCAVLWKKQFYVLFEERRAVDAIVSSPGHTDHCAQVLMDAPEMNRTQATRVEIGFTGCWIRD